MLLQNCEGSACVSHFTFAYSPRMLSYGVRRIGWWSAGGSDMALTRGHTMRGTFLFVGLLIALTVTHEAAAQDRSNQPFIVSQYTPTPSPSQPPPMPLPPNLNARSGGGPMPGAPMPRLQYFCQTPQGSCRLPSVTDAESGSACYCTRGSVPITGTLMIAQ